MLFYAHNSKSQPLFCFVYFQFSKTKLKPIDHHKENFPINQTEGLPFFLSFDILAWKFAWPS